MQKYAKKMNWVYPNTFVVIIYLEYYKGCIDDYWYSITHWADGNQLGIGARDKCWAIDFTKICNSLRLPQRRYLLFKKILLKQILMLMILILILKQWIKILLWEQFMANKIGIDTNVLVRYIAQDDEQSQIAMQFLENLSLKTRALLIILLLWN